MVEMRQSVDDLDLLRIGAYTGMEGNFRIHRQGFRFTYFLQTISDMRALIERVVYINIGPDKTYTQFYCKSLFKTLKSMGFYNFRSGDWNVPRAINLSESMRKEYFRCVVDSLGTVEIDKTVPYLRVSSINNMGLRNVQSTYGGKLFETRGRAHLQWKGRAMLEKIEYVDWRFNCRRNQKGADLIKSVNWDKFIF